MKVTCSWQLRKKRAILNRRKLKDLIIAIAELAGLELGADEVISVNFIGPRTMRCINREFLNHDYLTDVICFNYKNDSDFSDNDIAVEIFISPDIAEERATDNPKLKYESELLLYLVHAVLHAAGFKDKTPEDKKRMRRNEKRIINNSKIINLFQ